MDRLLSEQEIENTCYTATSPMDVKIALAVKAQLAKTDREWVEWIKGNLSLTMYTDDCNNSDGDSVCKCTPNAQLKCQLCQFQERKKDIGL